MFNRGFIALVTILIISSVALLVCLSVSFFALSEAQMSLQKNQSSQARYLANLCAEEALMKLKEDVNYQGNEVFNFEQGSCQILPIEGNWTIKVLADCSNQIKKLKIVLNQISPETEISSWQEVADF